MSNPHAHPDPAEPNAPAARPLPADRVLAWRVPLAAALAGALTYGLTRALAAKPGFVEAAYGQGLGPLLARPLSLATGVFPFAVSDAVGAVYLLWVGAALAFALHDVVRRRRRALNAVGGGALRMVRDAGLFVFLLYALWGFNYARPPFETRAGWPEWSGADPAEVGPLADAAVAAANRAYLELHGGPDAGAPTAMPSDPRALEAAIDAGWARAAAELGLGPSVGARYGRVKRPLTSPVLERLGISGVYIPFTGEATVARGLPAMRMPFSMAHEKAHQRGIANEAEASFLGFVACALAPDPLARYAAAMFAQGQLLAALPPPERRRIAATRLPGLERDLRDMNAYLSRHTGVAREVQTAVNDRYLRANRVPGGVQSYGLSVRLLIQYSRQNGGLLPGAGGESKGAGF